MKVNFTLVGEPIFFQLVANVPRVRSVRDMDLPDDAREVVGYSVRPRLELLCDDSDTRTNIEVQAYDDWVLRVVRKILCDVMLGGEGVIGCSREGHEGSLVLLLEDKRIKLSPRALDDRVGQDVSRHPVECLPLARVVRLRLAYEVVVVSATLGDSNERSAPWASYGV